LLLGLAGSLHCAGMCGPIAVALPGRSESISGRVVERGLYQSGRIMTYALLGALAGLGASIGDLAGYERVVSITAGVLMIAAAILQLLLHRSILPSRMVARLTGPVRHRLGMLLRNGSRPAMLGIGALNGLLPCGLVSSALFGSAATTDPIAGMTFMAAFGVGTLPVMMTLSLGGSLVTGRFRSSLRTALPVIAIMIGVLVVVRGMALGIPYVSPPAVTDHTTAGCCTTHQD